jgi:signaling intermediate in Toll pathway protein
MAKIVRLTRLVLASQIRLPMLRLAVPSTNFHTSIWGRPGVKDRVREKEENQKALEIKQGGFFDGETWSKKTEVESKRDKKMFEQAIAVYLKRERARRRGHVEFIYAAMKRMKEFGVEKDITTYKKLMDVFPKAIMAVKNAIQVEFMHFPRQQQCCIDMLQQMEDHGKFCLLYLETSSSVCIN